MGKCVTVLMALLLAAAQAAAATGDAGAAKAATADNSVDLGQQMSKCKYPDPPKMPDGSKATESEMGQAGADVRDYIAGVQSSLQCLSAIEKSLGDNITKDEEKTLVGTYNKGVDQMNTVADEYNKQVRAFKAR